MRLRRSAFVPMIYCLVCLPLASLCVAADAGCDAALLVIDVQKAFVSGVAWDTTAGEDIVDAVVEILSLARADDVPVIYVKDRSVLMFETVTESLLEFPDEIAPLADDPVFTKRSMSIFMEKAFLDYIAAQGIERLILCGIASEGCFAAALSGAVSKGLEVTVVADGHSNGPPDPTMDRRTAAEFNDEWSERGIAVIPTDDIDWASFACSP